MASSASFLSGKLAVITGGAGTIGFAVSRALLGAGANLVLTGRTMRTLQKARDRLTESSPSSSSVSCITCDVSDEESVGQLFRQVDQDHGGCDLLLNNAGVNAFGETTDLTAADFEKVMKINVLGPFLCSREALKQMKNKGEGGRIINVCSISALSPRPHSAPYTTSKFAMLGLSRSLALDGREHGVAVGIIHPGNVMSDMLPEEEVAARSGKEGFLEPTDVADCVLSMASLPYTSNVLEMTVIPTRQPLVGRG